MGQVIIETKDLSKTYDGFTAVDKLNLHIEEGEIFGFLGPNGAGNTKIIKVLTGLPRPDSGTNRVGGIECTHNPKGARHLVGIVPDESNPNSELTG